METKFTPIAMRCNQEQFDAIKPKFKNTKWKVLSGIMVDFKVDAYLVNNYKKNKIVNIHETCKANHSRTVYETWDEATFLRACGIEVDEPLTVSKEFILEAHNSACSTWKRKLEEQFPSVFVKDELGVGVWNYSKTKYGNFENLFKSDDGINWYGFVNGDWFEKTDISDFTTLNLRQSTPEEVETALINEAKKRGFKEGVKFKSVSPNIDGETDILINGDIYYSVIGNYVYSSCGYIFQNGKWATIIEQPTEMTVAEIEQKLGCKIKIVG